MAALTTREVLVELLDYRGEAVLEATTPHGTYTFNVVAVEGSGWDGAVLRLVEKDKGAY